MRRTAWQPDILGPDFEQTTLLLKPDAEGEVVATLVRYGGSSWERLRARFDVLYVHGWSDYFFQAELARFWSRRGGAFYALDLRKYGRSLRSHHTPGYVESLDTYDEDIAAALAVMRERSHRPLILMGHSTGGLTASLWASRHPDAAAGLVLNAPWLELQTGEVGRLALTPSIHLSARLHPHANYPSVDLGFYSRTTAKGLSGAWEYDMQWRPERGFLIHPGWLDAILAGHARVAQGLSIPAPILVLLSTRSMLQAAWSDDMFHADTAIDVTAVARRALDLGPDVSIRRFEGALHDVVLSEEPIRQQVWGAIRRWLPAALP